MITSIVFLLSQTIDVCVCMYLLHANTGCSSPWLSATWRGDMCGTVRYRVAVFVYSSHSTPRVRGTYGGHVTLAWYATPCSPLRSWQRKHLASFSKKKNISLVSARTTGEGQSLLPPQAADPPPRAAFGNQSNQNYTKRRMTAWSTKWSLFAKPFQGWV